MSQHDDAILVQRAQAGDRGAFDALISKHQTRAYQFAFRLTRSEDEAGDVVADAFVRVYAALPNFKGTSAFTTWLYRILTNCFLDARKRARNKVVVSIDATQSNGEGDIERKLVSEEPSPYEQSERGARERALEAAVASLPDVHRAMIVMFHGESLSYEEIAAAVDLPVGTVKSRLNRARIALREELSKLEDLFPARQG